MKKILGVVFLLLIAVALFFWQQSSTTAPSAVRTQGTQATKVTHEVSAPIAAKVSSPNTIHFTVTKEGTMLYLDGAFTNRAQARRFAKNLRPTYSTRRLQNDTNLSDKGGIALASKILPLFKKRYAKGKIEYRDGVLTVEGTVRSQKISTQMDTLLQGSTFSAKNLTQIDPSVRLATPIRSHIRHKKRKTKRHAKRKKRTTQSKKMAKVSTKSSLKDKTPQKGISKKSISKKRIHPKASTQTKQIPKSQIPTPATQIKTEKQKAREATRSIRTLLKAHKIEFKAAKGALTPKGQASVDQLANILKKYPVLHVEIAGYTDSDGSESFNQRLSQKRVDTVKKRLIAKGINPKRLRAKGYGESHPLVPNTSDANKQKNRRVEINILRRL